MGGDRLLAQPASHRALIIVSDGASVDDATLMHNGPSYLERHLQAVIARLEPDSRLTLGAVGLSFSVGRYYAQHRQASVDTLPMALAEIVAEIVSSQ